MERGWQRNYANHAEAIKDITDHIVGFYNNIRLHSKLGYLPLTIYEIAKTNNLSMCPKLLDHYTAQYQTLVKSSDSLLSALEDESMSFE